MVAGFSDNHGNPLRTVEDNDTVPQGIGPPESTRRNLNAGNAIEENCGPQQAAEDEKYERQDLNLHTFRYWNLNPTTDSRNRQQDQNMRHHSNLGCTDGCRSDCGRMLEIVVDRWHHLPEFIHDAIEYNRLQRRIDIMYVDKLDGRIDARFFDQKLAEWRDEQNRLMDSIAEHQQANESYISEGVMHLELANRASELFECQPASEKRRLLDFVLSNCTWKDGELTPVFRQPFDMIADMATACATKKVAGDVSGDFCQNELPEAVSTRFILCRTWSLVCQEVTSISGHRPSPLDGPF